MAELVGGFLIPHDPLIAARPDAPPEALQYEGFEIRLVVNHQDLRRHDFTDFGKIT